MLMVCQDHVTQGLRKLPVPHVKRIPENMNISCFFCNQKAKVKLFIPDNHHVMNKQKKRNIRFL